VVGEAVAGRGLNSSQERVWWEMLWEGRVYVEGDAMGGHGVCVGRCCGRAGGTASGEGAMQMHAAFLSRSIIRRVGWSSALLVDRSLALVVMIHPCAPATRNTFSLSQRVIAIRHPRASLKIQSTTKINVPGCIINNTPPLDRASIVRWSPCSPT